MNIKINIDHTYAMNEILYILFTASIAYVVLFIIAKFLGKKQIAELDFIDYVTGISIGSIAAEMATDLERPFFYFVISMAVFFIFDLVVTLLGRKTNFLKVFLRGRPLILISKGKIDFKMLKKSKIDLYDLMGLARDKGFFDLSEIEYAIFETNGDLSILSIDEARELKREDFPAISAEQAEIPLYLIVDGAISGFALENAKKTKKWVKEKLGEQDTKLKDVMYATFDEQNDNIIITPYPENN